MLWPNIQTGEKMPFWQRLIILIIAILVISFLFDLLWQYVLGFALPAYVTGVVGGLAAVPVWDLLKRIKPKQKQV
jgi:hypothetical protein